MTRPHWPTQCLPAIAAISAVFLTGCFDFVDILAVHNQTETPLLVSVTMDAEFARYTCDGSGSDLERFEGEAQFEVAPGQRICLEGPAKPHEEAYDARDLLTHIEVQRGTATCLDSDGEGVRERFTAEGMHKTLPIDDTQCPAPP